MKAQRRTNLLWGLIFLAVAIIILLRAFDAIPNGIYDLLSRGWPALLVVGGLSIFLRERMRLGSLIALVVGLALVGGLAAAAFSSRATQSRDAYQQAIDQPIGQGVNLLHVQVQLLSSDVELVRSLQTGSVSGQFVGSSESLLQSDYSESGDGTATLVIRETHPNQFPSLEAVGRGHLHLELPAGTPLDVSFIGENGLVSLTMDGLSLERLNMDLFKGDAVVTLPSYKPLGSPADALLGALVAREGNLTLIVPPSVAAHLELNRGSSGLQPIFDATVYNYLVGDVLESRSFDTADIKVRYGVTAPRGQITIETSPS